MWFAPLFVYLARLPISVCTYTVDCSKRGLLFRQLTRFTPIVPFLFYFIIFHFHSPHSLWTCHAQVGWLSDNSVSKLLKTDSNTFSRSLCRVFAHLTGDWGARVVDCGEFFCISFCDWLHGWSRAWRRLPIYPLASRWYVWQRLSCWEEVLLRCHVRQPTAERYTQTAGAPKILSTVRSNSAKTKKIKGTQKIGWAGMTKVLQHARKDGTGRYMLPKNCVSRDNAHSTKKI